MDNIDMDSQTINLITLAWTIVAGVGAIIAIKFARDGLLLQREQAELDKPNIHINVVPMWMSADKLGARLLYLPPYSPDLSPIEPAFSKFKQVVRSAGHRRVDALWNDLQRMLDQINANDAAGFIGHCGYKR